MGRNLSTLTLILLCAAVAQANTFKAEGGLLEPTHAYRTIADRNLVPDGDFEQGTCLTGNSAWTCTADNDCDWIVDLVPLGLWNYSGEQIAWLGGFCAGLATCWSTVCQEVDLGGNGHCLLNWFWMAYVNEALGSEIRVTVDGTTIYTHIIDDEDHLLDYQPQYAEIVQYTGYHTLCFEYHNEDDCERFWGDNYFADFVEVLGVTSSEVASFSVVKTLY